MLLEIIPDIIEATGLWTGIVGATLAAGSAGASFAQAAAQKSKASQARRDSKELMRRARDKMQQDFYQAVNVPLEAYERSFRENTAQQRQSIQALQGADARTLAAGIGQVGAVGVDANEADRLVMEEALYKNKLLKAKSKSDIRDELVGMDVGGAKDATQMERDAEIAQANAISGGFSALGSAVGAVGAGLPTYTQTAATKRAGKLANVLQTDKIPKIQQLMRDPNPDSATYNQMIPMRDANKIRPADYLTNPATKDLKPGDPNYIALFKDSALYETPDQHLTRIQSTIEQKGYTRKKIKEIMEYLQNPLTKDLKPGDVGYIEALDIYRLFN